MAGDWLNDLRRVNLNQIGAFSAVVECSSFRAAAARLHLSQSALSVQVQQLESALGVKLLHRDTRSVQLTDEGARLVEVFNRSGVELARVITQLKEEGRLQRGAILLAVLPSLAATYMAQLLQRFQTQHPGIRVKMRDVDSRRAHEQIEAGAVDLAVLSRSPRGQGMVFTPLFDEELLAVVPASDSAFAGLDAVGVRELARNPLLLNPTGVDLRDKLDMLFQSEDIAVEAAQELTGTSTLVALVSLGMGVSIQPRSSLYGLDLSRCRLLAFRPATFREIGVLMPPGRTPSPAATAFKDFLVEHAASVSLPDLAG
jgi:DNA-binding transcriptional LysR family regulator